MCVPASTADCGIPVEWRSPCIGYSVQRDGTRVAALDAVTEAMEQAFGVWQAQNCSEKVPAITVSDLGPSTCGLVEYNGKAGGAGNANIIVFRDDAWPHASSDIALTTVTFDEATGELVDADMEVNSAGQVLSLATPTPADAYDLVGVLTHEAGHFLGLAHSDVAEATMRPAYAPGIDELRSLASDDTAAICAAYPPTGDAPSDAECNPIPRHGFSRSCGDAEDIPQCGVAREAMRGRGRANVVVVLALAVWVARGRSRKRRNPVRTR